jgi:hypothetical protein
VGTAQTKVVWEKDELCRSRTDRRNGAFMRGVVTVTAVGVLVLREVFTHLFEGAKLP